MHYCKHVISRLEKSHNSSNTNLQRSFLQAKFILHMLYDETSVVRGCGSKDLQKWAKVSKII